MKSLFSLICGTLIFYSALGQDVGDKTLISQSRTTNANIGNCLISIKYHSPGVNNRKIFGGIVPFDFVIDEVEYPWRAGSNQRTSIDFSHNVTINGVPLEAGSYGFLVLVSKDKWTLIFSKGKTWGAFNYDPANDVLRTEVAVHSMPFQEWLSYEYINPKSESVDIQLGWEKSQISFTVATNASKNVFDDLTKKEIKTAEDYQNMAIWLVDQDSTKIDEALQMIEQSLERIVDEDRDDMRAVYAFNGHMLKADLLIKKGQIEKGHKIKEEFFKRASGFNIYYYALRKYSVEGSKAEALAILEEQIALHPDNLQNHFALGEYYLYEKNQAKAVAHFARAYFMCLEQSSTWTNYARYLYLQSKLVLENMSAN